jgi:hypothetical protein
MLSNFPFGPGRSFGAFRKIGFIPDPSADQKGGQNEFEDFEFEFIGHNAWKLCLEDISKKYFCPKP